MSDQEKKAEVKEMTQEDLVKYLIYCAKKEFNINLNKNQIGILVAQNNLETGHRKHMYNYNIGNIKHVHGDGHDYFVLNNVIEYKNKKQIKEKSAMFRHYDSPQDGVTDYLRNIKNRGGGLVWNAVLRGDPAAFSKALKQTGYYTANEEDTIDPKTGKQIPGYTTSIINGLNAFNKSDSYNKAISEGIDDSMLAENEYSASQHEIDDIYNMLSSLLKSLSNRNYSKSRFIKNSKYKI